MNARNLGRIEGALGGLSVHPLIALAFWLAYQIQTRPKGA